MGIYQNRKYGLKNIIPTHDVNTIKFFGDTKEFNLEITLKNLATGIIYAKGVQSKISVWDSYDYIFKASALSNQLILEMLDENAILNFDHIYWEIMKIRDLVTDLIYVDKIYQQTNAREQLEIASDKIDEALNEVRLFTSKEVRRQQGDL